MGQSESLKIMWRSKMPIKERKQGGIRVKIRIGGWEGIK